MSTGLDPKRMQNWATSKLGDTSADTGLDPSGEPDENKNFAQDTAGIPGDGGFIQNKFVWGTDIGDQDPLQLVGDGNDNAVDFEHDTAGIPNVDQGETYTMPFSFDANRFPRQTGSDSNVVPELT